MTDRLVPAADILGNEVAKSLEVLHKDLEAARERMQRLLAQVGKPAVCRGPNCGKGLWMVKHNSGRFTPYDPDGTNHFITCIDAPLFKREKEKHAR